jgi:hypothetical protein
MFGFTCKHCGHVEMLHVGGWSEYLGENFGYAVTDTSRYFGMEHIDASDVTLYEIENHVKKGYPHNLNNCPGFEYKKTLLSGDVLLRKYFDHRDNPYVDTRSMPKELKKKKERLFTKWEREVEEAERLARPKFPYMPVEIYITYDPRTGVSSISTG